MHMGARSLTQHELDDVTGGIITSVVSVIFTNNGKDYSTDE
jgi:hypothetical protein